MSKAKRTVLGVLSLFFIAVLAAGFVYDAFTRSSLVNMEQQITGRMADAVIARVDDALSSLTGSVSDWAMWDETYAFAASGGSSFVERNLDAQSVQALDIDIYALYNAGGNLVYSTSFDDASGTFSNLESETTDFLGKLVLSDDLQESGALLVHLDGEYHMLAFSRTTDSQK
ncbi:MAG TPA: CHASE4 domain-containing protein, partial [Clostridia bacterium]